MINPTLFVQMHFGRIYGEFCSPFDKWGPLRVHRFLGQLWIYSIQVCDLTFSQLPTSLFISISSRNLCDSHFFNHFVPTLYHKSWLGSTEYSSVCWSLFRFWFVSMNLAFSPSCTFAVNSLLQWLRFLMEWPMNVICCMLLLFSRLYLLLCLYMFFSETTFQPLVGYYGVLVSMSMPHTHIEQWANYSTSAFYFSDVKSGFGL